MFFPLFGLPCNIWYFFFCYYKQNWWFTLVVSMLMFEVWSFFSFFYGWSKETDRNLPLSQIPLPLSFLSSHRFFNDLLQMFLAIFSFKLYFKIWNVMFVIELFVWQWTHKIIIFINFGGAWEYICPDLQGGTGSGERIFRQGMGAPMILTHPINITIIRSFCVCVCVCCLIFVRVLEK